MSNKLSLPILLFCCALAIRGLFAFLETTITALRLFKLKELAQSVKRYELLFSALEKRPHRVLVTALIASSFAEVMAASLGTSIVEQLFSYLHVSRGIGFSIGITITSITIIVIGEIIPKSLAKRHGERFFCSLLWIMTLGYRLLYPLVSLLMHFSDSIVQYISDPLVSESTGDLTSEREIRFLIDYTHSKGLLEDEKTEMIQNIFELGRTPVKEIMVPTADMICLNVETSIKNSLEVFAEYQFTRLPVFANKEDNIIGMVHQKDIFLLFSRAENKTLSQLVRPIMFIPESVKINQLLREFRQQQMHMAIVLNEYGSITGLITLEDVLEEIVGDINDEHEPMTEKIISLQQGGWMVDASITLEELSDVLAITFAAEGVFTLAGFLTEQLQHLPQKGERLLYADFYFQVQKASNKRVTQVLIFAQNAHQESHLSE